LNRGEDANLTATWVSTVQSQGWGFIPTWFGRQAPCACGPGSTSTKCVHFTYTISSTLSTAQAQGKKEADAAISAAKALGITPTIIYHDIESYTPSTPASACDLAVIAFLGGWVGELHPNYAAGVYGNPLPAQKDFAKVSPLPDDVWIAKWPQPITDPLPSVSIWGLGSLKDNLWANSQRIHQYEDTVTSTYGGSLAHIIDPNIVDATIVRGTESKNYNFTFTSFDDPDATNGTFGLGINNINRFGTLINESLQIGQIVGYYVDSSPAAHGFLYQAGIFSSIDYPGAKYTYASGINDNNQIVGIYVDTNLHDHGFLYQLAATPAFSSIDYPGAIKTEAHGINDNNQIVGCYEDSSGVNHGFLYQEAATPPFRSIDYPGATNTVCEFLASGAYAVNGDGDIVGVYDDSSGVSHGFLYQKAATPPFSSIDYPGAKYTYANGINNNNQILGSSAAGMFLDQAGSFSTIPPSFTSVMTPSGINDYSQIVGIYYDSKGYHGFLAVP
jgi:probable HAF family extracellular repeat protein